KWKTEDSTVRGWLINSLDPSLISNFIRFPTAKAIWDLIATTLFDDKDTSQVYDLKRRVTRMKQDGGPIEKYYNGLQGIWREIDFRRPNPMVCAADIEKYNLTIQEDRVYLFLDGLDDHLDNVCADVLQMQPFPTVEQAYARVRREELRQAVMLSNPDSTHAAATTLKGVQTDSRQIPTLQLSKPGDSFDDGRNRTAQKTKITKESGCTKCGNPRHTVERCFQVHGYPEWWKELKARKQAGRGKAAMVTAEPELSLVPQDECPINSTMPCDEGKNGCVFMSSKQRQPCGWIIDSGASLKLAPGKGLLFSKNTHLNIEGYTDADWAGSISDRRSTSGYFTFVGGNLVTWRSKKQKVVALSSAEAKFRGMARAICELLWFRKLMTEIGFAPKSAMSLFCDNKDAIEIAHNPVQHDRTKHVEVDRHFIKEKIDAKEVRFPFVKTEDQLADVLSKAVSSKVFYNSLGKLGIHDIYAPT
ncbi:UBN2_3 domain-containing protein, partial [Cephalotus follicularis]